MQINVFYLTELKKKKIWTTKTINKCWYRFHNLILRIGLFFLYYQWSNIVLVFNVILGMSTIAKREFGTSPASTECCTFTQLFNIKTINNFWRFFLNWWIYWLQKKNNIKNQSTRTKIVFSSYISWFNYSVREITYTANSSIKWN